MAEISDPAAAKRSDKASIKGCVRDRIRFFNQLNSAAAKSSGTAAESSDKAAAESSDKAAAESSDKAAAESSDKAAAESSDKAAAESSDKAAAESSDKAAAESSDKAAAVSSDSESSDPEAEVVTDLVLEARVRGFYQSSAAREGRLLDWDWVLEAREEAKKRYGEKKLVFLLLPRRNNDPSPEWVSIDPHVPPDCFCLRPVYLMGHPRRLTKLLSYGMSVNDQKEIYFVGGDHGSLYSDYSRKVTLFNVQTRRWWYILDFLNIARRYPTVVAAGKKLYVFGGSTNDDALSKEDWAEYLDLEYEQSEWKFLPDIPPFVPSEQISVHFHAVYEAKNQILLWVYTGEYRNIAIYAYDYIADKWVDKPRHVQKINEPMPIFPPVIVEDIIYWHYFGQILGLDLQTGECSMELDIPDSPFDHPEYSGELFCFETSLLSVGDSKLCLVWYSHEMESIGCYVFQIKTNQAGLQSGSPVFIPTRAWSPICALPVLKAYL